MRLKRYLWALLVFPWHLLHAQSLNDSVFSTAALASVHLFDAASGQLVSVPGGRGLRLFVFLSPECPLCQNYSLTLNRLQRQYAGRVSFFGIVPGKTWKATDITAFGAKYHVSYPLWLDRSFEFTHSLHASATPEVILLTPGGELIYKGAIDNWFKALGRSRGRPTENYLQDAIDRALRHEPALVKRTVPVGCLINDF